MPHLGCHPNDYHDWILEQVRQIDLRAQGDRKMFLHEFENVKSIVSANPIMLRRQGWR